jgi:chorismate-pyruvate lyase
MPSVSGKSQKVAAAVPFLHPLDDFYVQQGMALPSIEVIDGADVPEPYGKLLVHSADMTPTLEAFHGCKVHLQVLRRQQRDDFYFREVVLLLNGSDQPVEFGAIKINLALFPSVARREILEERLPLGQILHQNKISHASKPKAYLRVEADDFIRSALKMSESSALYGRRNTLSDPMQRSLAEIVEILPPISQTISR